MAWGVALNLRVEQIDQNAETDTSLDFAFDCGYLSTEEHERLCELSREVGKMLGSMIANPQPFLIE